MWFIAHLSPVGTQSTKLIVLLVLIVDTIDITSFGGMLPQKLTSIEIYLLLGLLSKLDNVSVRLLLLLFGLNKSGPVLDVSIFNESIGINDCLTSDILLLSLPLQSNICDEFNEYYISATMSWLIYSMLV